MNTIVCTVLGGALLSSSTALSPAALNPTTLNPTTLSPTTLSPTTGIPATLRPATGSPAAARRAGQDGAVPAPAGIHEPPVDRREALDERAQLRASRAHATETTVQPPAAAARSATRRAGSRAPRRPAHTRPLTAAPPGRPSASLTSQPPTGQPVGGAPRSVVDFALGQVGKRYGYGSAGPDRFDCSGLVAAAYRRIGIFLPHQTGALAGRGRAVGRAELRPGDLVFPSAGHVGIYIGGGRMVHASTEDGGVKVSPVYAFRSARRLVG